MLGNRINLINIAEKVLFCIMKNITIENWKTALNNKYFRYSFIAVIIIFFAQMSFVSCFQAQIELRNGIDFNDPIMQTFAPVDLDIPTFIAIYTAHLLALFFAFKKPETFFHFIIGYLFVYLFRIISIYLLPLDPPIDTIVLKDPILYWFGGGYITKDLFYSGHTASTFLAFLITNNKKAKIYIFIALLVIVAGTLFQKVHYTVDVYAAFFFSFTAYRLSLFIKNKIIFLCYKEHPK